MKLSFFLLAFIFMIPAAKAQKKLPDFGKIDLSDLEMKDCSFDPGVDAYALIDWGNMYFIRNPDEGLSFTMIYERRVRIKILKEAGLAYANLSVPFYSINNEEKITNISACTFNITEGHTIKKTNVYRNTIYNRKISKQRSEITLVFPEVKVGSVIEYKYKVQRKTIADVKDWYFQSSIPTRYSEYQVSVPPVFHFTMQPITVDSLEVKQITNTERIILKSGIVSTQVLQKNFIMRNLPGIRNEPYMGAAKDYLQRLSLQLSGIDYGNGNMENIRSSWEDIATELMNDPDFGGQINARPAGAKGIIEATNNLATAIKRIGFILDYIKKNLQWDGRQDIYAYDGIKKTFQRKTGSSADINLLLISLLNQAGIPTLPVLFSTRDNGLVNTALPFINQFNTVMALVEDNKKYFILDATDAYSSYHLVPAGVVNTKGLVVEPGNVRWLDAADSINKYKVTTAIRADIAEPGIMKGDVLISGSGYARKAHYRNWIADKIKTGYLTGENNMIRVDGAEINNPENDSLPFEQKLKFSTQINNTGELYYFKLNMFSELEKNLFMSAGRRTDIDFGYQQEYTMYGNYTVPVDYVFEELPQNISLITPDTGVVFKRFINADNNSLNVRMSIEFKRSWYTAGEYPEFAAFYKILLSKLNEQVIIKKKN